MVRSPMLTKLSSGVKVKGSRPDSRHQVARSGSGTRCLVAHGLERWPSICRGVVPQHPPTRFSKPCCAKSAEYLRHVLGRVVVFAEFVGQAGVGIEADRAVGDPRQFLDPGSDFGGAERAVQARRRRGGVTDRIPESFHGLTGQCSAAGVDDGARDDDRQAIAECVEGLGDCRTEPLCS